MDERARRLWAGAEADAIGYGGVAAVEQVRRGRAASRPEQAVRRSRPSKRGGNRSVRSDTLTHARYSSPPVRTAATARGRRCGSASYSSSPTSWHDPCQPLRARNEQVEQDRTSVVLLHLDQLAGQAAADVRDGRHLIGNTTNRGGLVVRARLDRRRSASSSGQPVRRVQSPEVQGAPARIGGGHRGEAVSTARSDGAAGRRRTCIFLARSALTASGES